MVVLKLTALIFISLPFQDVAEWTYNLFSH